MGADKGEDKPIFGVDFSSEQLFFIQFARGWCQAMHRGELAGHHDVHSPNYARVIAVLQNHPHFGNAFGCKKGSRMNPKKKCSVWGTPAIKPDQDADGLNTMQMTALIGVLVPVAICGYFQAWFIDRRCCRSR